MSEEGSLYGLLQKRTLHRKTAQRYSASAEVQEVLRIHYGHTDQIVPRSVPSVCSLPFRFSAKKLTRIHQEEVREAVRHTLRRYRPIRTFDQQAVLNRVHSRRRNVTYPYIGGGPGGG